MMKRYIEINEIPDNGYKINGQISASSLEIDDELEFQKPIVVAIDIKKIKDEAATKGLIEFSIKQPCSLCLKNFISEIKSSFEIEFKSSPAKPDEEEKELEREDVDVVYLKEAKIDLFDIIKEQIFLSLPMKPVCNPKCLGLCPQCGINLNIEKCSCMIETIDPRFAVLKKLKTKG